MGNGCSAKSRDAILSTIVIEKSNKGPITGMKPGDLSSSRYVATIPPILYFILFGVFFFIPESPIWLLGHKEESQAKKSLAWLRFIKEK